MDRRSKSLGLIKVVSASVAVWAVTVFSPAEAQTVRVRAQLTSPGLVIPENFIGFSSEIEDFVGGIYSANNTSLIGLLGLLGPNGVMRIGGGTEEDVPADPLTQDVANDAAAFLNALGSGWTLLYGLADAVNDPSLAVQHAGYLLNALGRNRVAFQIGNEPNLNLGSEGAWLNVFTSYYQALTAA
ncbi:MAG: hypothetical protein JO007_04175, partial [Alphaproteobacteria bacterium]|nr:hypothetical protein [Alphaproteobacteria bacterium]